MYIFKLFHNIYIYLFIYLFTAEAYQELNLIMKRELYNVRFFHCFQDEDHIGTCKGLARRVHRKLLELRVLGRFLLRLSTYKRARTTVLLRGRHGVKKKVMNCVPPTTIGLHRIQYIYNIYQAIYVSLYIYIPISNTHIIYVLIYIILYIYIHRCSIYGLFTYIWAVLGVNR